MFVSSTKYRNKYSIVSLNFAKMHKNPQPDDNNCNNTNVSNARYDELEQQAMEQYRTSEESLALKYQV